jgi:hypothetical protein
MSFLYSRRDSLLKIKLGDLVHWGHTYGEHTACGVSHWPRPHVVEDATVVTCVMCHARVEC